MADGTCSVSECDRRAQASGMCEMHRKRWRKHGDPNITLRRRTWAGVSCSIAGCDRGASGRGLCDAHLQRLRKHGDPMPSMPLIVYHRELSLYDRVMAKSHDEPSGCRLFDGACNSRGYGHLTEGGRTYYAHRIVLAHHHGVSDLPALHLCDTRRCVNIEHLRYGTPADNTADMLRRGRAWWQKKP